LEGGQSAKIANDVIHDCDVLLDFGDGRVLTIAQSTLLSEQGASAEFMSREIAPQKPATAGANESVAELDDESVAEILKCVGLNDTPRNLDREQLKNDINAALDFFQGYKAESSKSRRTQLRSCAGKFGRAAQNLSDVLDQSDLVSTLLQKRISHRICLTEFQKQLHDLVQLCQALSNAYSDASSMSDEIRISPLYLFLGDSLAAIFEKHFKQSAKRTRNSGGQLEGPFIRFATAVTARLGDSITGETVSKAMAEVAKARRESE
jgi:hypothetical protein